MFNQILAIDVLKRIPNFYDKAKFFVKKKPLVVSSVTDLETINLNEVDAIFISIYETLDERFLKQFVNLRAIFVLGTSDKKIAIDYCKACNIKIFVVADYCDHETAEWVMLNIIKLFRQAKVARSVYKRKLGVIGVGSVGKNLIEMAYGFHMEVFFNARSENNEIKKFAQPRTKEEIFKTSDVISFHTPPHFSWLTKAILDHARPDLGLINTCMGRISIGKDLENFLKTRPDVTMIMDKIASASYQDLNQGALLSDEAAFLTSDSEARLIDKFFSNISSFLNLQA